MNCLLIVTTFVLLNLVHLSMNQTTNTTVTCSSGESRCGSKCYSIETHKCKSGFVCRTEEGWCGNTCFKPLIQKCIWGLICLKSEIWCNNKCINPTTQQCRTKKLIDIIMN
ncbi:unnamed protein product [Adineta steineri]|uniref:Uncharacterized protein n=1 Tax=Adineta steineri TaxID=433720 RepID=A0A815P2X2_9BILA|nr:unnamed protein product [Adineta steineri]